MKTRFIPKDSVLTYENKEFGIEVYTDAVKKTAIMYAGKSNKKLFYSRFITIDRMNQYITENINRIINIKTERKNEILKKRELSKNIVASDHFKIDDIVVNSWGWEQTNVNFYKVVEVKNKTIKIVEVCSIMQSSGGNMSGYVVPDISKIYENSDSYTLRVKADAKGNMYLSNPKSFYYMSKWDGQPEYCSWYA